MSLDCDSEIIKYTLTNLREELKDEKNKNKLYEGRIKDLMDVWRKERKEYEKKIENLENLLEIQSSLDD